MISRELLGAGAKVREGSALLAERIEAERYRRIQREAARSMAAQGFPTTCQGRRYV